MKIVNTSNKKNSISVTKYATKETRHKNYKYNIKTLF